MQDPVEIGSDTEDFLGNEDEPLIIPDEGEIDVRLQIDQNDATN